MLGDPYEYAAPKPSRDRWVQTMSYLRQQEIINLGTGLGPKERQQKILDIDAKYHDTLRRIAQDHFRMSQELYVNCWHINDYESAAMWRLYLKSDEGIAIQTTVGAFKVAIANEPRKIRLGTIRYIDYDNDYVDLNNWFNYALHKRLSFAHQKEIRAVIHLHEPLLETIARAADELERSLPPDETLEGKSVGIPTDALRQPTPPGLAVQVDPQQLIQTIYIAPSKDLWFAELVSSVVRRYGIAANVLPSNLLDAPATLASVTLT